MHGGVCGQELNPLIESGEIDVSALNNDTTTVPDDVPPEPADKSALLFRYNNHLVCQLCWQTDICLRVSKVTDAIAATVADVTNANQVAGRESAVLRTWGKRMVEGSGKDTYSSKKAKFKGERSRFTIGQKLAILDETRQPNALQTDVLRKHHLARSTFARWRKQEKEWRAQIKKTRPHYPGSTSRRKTRSFASAKL